MASKCQQLADVPAPRDWLRSHEHAHRRCGEFVIILRDGLDGFLENQPLIEPSSAAWLPRRRHAAWGPCVFQPPRFRITRGWVSPGEGT
jgi:hypothetical protein